MTEKINFYSPITDERTGKVLYGAAAMNYRVYVAGGLNNLSFNLIHTGIQMGFAQAIQSANSNKVFK